MNAYEFIIRLRDQATGGLRQLAASVGITQNRVRDLDADMLKMNRTSGLLGIGLSALKGAFLGLVAGVSLLTLTNQIIDARSEYEKFQAVLSNSFQSVEVGQAALTMLTQFAEKTPYQLNELTGAFIKLVNRGFNPTYEQLTNLGDLASSQGKSFDQLTEAILDAESAEFERLKEFGIKASKAGDQITLSFKGTTKTVQNNAGAIRQAILEYGKMKGVADSMDVISKTLGGKISNLGDQFWGFLVMMGGFSSPIFDSFFNGLGASLDFLIYALPYVAQWFTILWQSLSPLVSSIWEFISAAFSFGEAGTWINTFGNIMSGVLLIVDYFSTGLTWLFDVLQPFAPLILTIAAAWAIFNLMVAISPVGWIVIGIVALITVIGMAIKYTNGWGKSWEAISKIFKAVWSQIKSDFNLGVEAFKTGFKLMILHAENTAQSIIGKFVNLGKAIEMALAGDFEGAMSKAFEKVRTKADEEIKKTIKDFAKVQKENNKTRIDNAKTIVDASKNIGISLDTEGIKKDFNKVKDKFSNLGQTATSTAAYDAYASTGGGLAKPDGIGKDKSDKDKNKKDGIVSGGSKQTNFYINIDSVGKEITINVDNTEKGISTLGDKVREEILRAINSINQLQTN
ncbi:hypothetical protein HX001_00120 [Empedobacter brevis]|uniref:Tape measure protein n=1 Tax=Empedobacter brevis TaxID=247 RepID=A0AAJ1QBD4_9FLAO|nr:hypothetical protein [Empedobacter brevis]MDM1070890.1 hypothetical protein [Empedobacter brevis]